MSYTDKLKPCPHCGSDAHYRGDPGQWMDDSRYVQLELGCCAIITETIGWRRARDMTVQEREIELKNRLSDIWNKRHEG